jgi:hypothetical protein
MRDKTNNNSREWIHSSQIKSLRYSKLKSPPLRKISDFMEGQKIFDDWFDEKMNQPVNNTK